MRISDWSSDVCSSDLRPQPARPSASAAARSTRWKYGLVASADSAGEIHLPPQPDDATSVPMADAKGTVSSFTVDRLAYSPSPPIVFAVVDFDGGGRLPVELTDVDEDRSEEHTSELQSLMRSSYAVLC